jgi:hypothetical protein
MGVTLVVLFLGILRYGVWILSTDGLISACVGLLIPAYLVFFGFRLWVYLYDGHLELHPRLAKLIKDHLGISLYTPKVIYYRQIEALRRTRGFGGVNALGILLKDRKSWQRTGYGIPYQGVENYADLEAELLRRVPPTCELYSVNFLGHRGPFK